MPRRSAAVYRRRRLALLLALVLVIAVIGVSIWLVVAKPWANAAESETPKPTAPASDTSSPVATDTATASTQPTSEETPGIVGCEAKDVVVEALTDADTYEAGVLPQLSIRLTNNGSTDCTIDVGSSTQVFTVSSGDDVWWRSTDCQQNPSSMIATLAAGATVESKTPVTWDRTRSSVETCSSENRPHAPGGGASYHVDVQIGGFAGTVSKQILLY
jgi:cytoskeletal protein RodZ